MRHSHASLSCIVVPAFSCHPHCTHIHTRAHTHTRARAHTHTHTHTVPDSRGGRSKWYSNWHSTNTCLLTFSRFSVYEGEERLRLRVLEASGGFVHLHLDLPLGIRHRVHVQGARLLVIYAGQDCWSLSSCDCV